MDCPNCGKEDIKEESVYCPNCGMVIQRVHADVRLSEKNTDPSSASEQLRTSTFYSSSAQGDSGSPVTAKIDVWKRNMKILIPVILAVSVVLVGIIMLLTLLGPSKESRAIKKAWESKDINQVIQAYSPDSADSRKALYDCVVEATKEVNEHFSFEVKEDQNTETIDTIEAAVENALTEYIKTQWGTLFITNDHSCSKLYDIAHLMPALENFSEMLRSKKIYFMALSVIKNTEDVDDYLKAVDLLLEVLPEDKNRAQVSDQVNEAVKAYINRMIELADSYMVKNDYNGAIKLLEKALESLDFEGNNNYSADIATKVSQAKASYAGQYAQKAEDSFKAGDIEAAVGNIEAAAAIAPNTGYEAKQKEYQLYLPFALYEKDHVLSRSSNYRIGFETSLKSLNNKEYRDCLEYNYFKDCDPETISYYLDGKYDTVSGVFFSPRSNAENNFTGKAHFEAYGDGKLLYTSKTLGAESLPVDVKFSVSGVQKLEIKFIGSSTYDGWNEGDTIALAGLTARKNISQ